VLVKIIARRQTLPAQFYQHVLDTFRLQESKNDVCSIPLTDAPGFQLRPGVALADFLFLQTNLVKTYQGNQGIDHCTVERLTLSCSKPPRVDQWFYRWIKRPSRCTVDLLTRHQNISQMLRFEFPTPARVVKSRN